MLILLLATVGAAIALRLVWWIAATVLPALTRVVTGVAQGFMAAAIVGGAAALIAVALGGRAVHGRGVGDADRHAAAGSREATRFTASAGTRDPAYGGGARQDTLTRRAAVAAAIGAGADDRLGPSRAAL